MSSDPIVHKPLTDLGVSDLGASDLGASEAELAAERLLVERARGGDEEAFGALVEERREALFELARRLTGSAAGAEDAVQEALLKAWKGLERFDGRSRFSTWLHRIVANSALDQRRRTARRPAPSEGEAIEVDVLSSPSPGPLQETLASEIGQRVEDGLNGLTPLERSAFELRHIEERPISEIGRVLGTRTSATKQAVFRAVHKLRRELAPLATFGVVLLLLWIGFTVGRRWPAADPEGATPVEELAVGLSAADRERILTTAITGHLESSARLLVEISNAPDTMGSVGGEAGAARRLLRANRLYRQSSESAGRREIEAVLGNLERLLLELANPRSGLAPADAEMLRISVERVLFEVRLLSAALRHASDTSSVPPSSLPSLSLIQTPENPV